MSDLDFRGPRYDLEITKGYLVRLPMEFPADVDLEGSSFRGRIRGPYSPDVIEFAVTVTGQDVVFVAETSALDVGIYRYALTWVESTGEPTPLMWGEITIGLGADSV